MLDGIANQIEHYLDLLSSRQRLVASNIANVDTPGFKTKDFDFQSEFRSAISAESPSPTEVHGLKTRNDGNNVSLDRESRLLSENAIRFNLASQLLKSQVRALKSAIEEGKSA